MGLNDRMISGRGDTHSITHSIRLGGNPSIVTVIPFDLIKRWATTSNINIPRELSSMQLLVIHPSTGTTQCTMYYYHGMWCWVYLPKKDLPWLWNVWVWMDGWRHAEENSRGSFLTSQLRWLNDAFIECFQCSRCQVEYMFRVFQISPYLHKWIIPRLIYHSRRVKLRVLKSNNFPRQQYRWLGHIKCIEMVYQPNSLICFLYVSRGT